MKTTVEQRAELRRLADNRSVLKWPELIDLLDDFAVLEAENEKLKAEREQMLEALSRYEEQVQKLEEIVEDM